MKTSTMNGKVYRHRTRGFNYGDCKDPNCKLCYDYLHDVPPVEPNHQTRQGYDTQEFQVLRHLREKDTLTTMEALGNYGITRLAARVHTLRRKGHKITTETVKKGRKRFARYALAS